MLRDYVRAHSHARERYESVKREAASVWRDDGWGYSEAKTELILTLLDEAEVWARGT